MDVQTTNQSYQVLIEPGIITRAGEEIKKAAPASSYLIIVDENVATTYLSIFLLLSKKFPYYVVPSGEASKSFSQYESLLDYCLQIKLDRSSVILAFGGGVVGDLAGFVAGTYMRGIRFVQIPTTLLAHDSSVGGKVAINLADGKNMVGVFHQPELVLYDPNVLKTLPEKEWRSGFAEIVKMGFITDRAFFEWLHLEVTDLKAIKQETLIQFIAKAVQLKAAIVQQDEREDNVRALLNFGHTLGHAIEAELGYGAITHGEAVAIGMRFAIRLGNRILSHSIDGSSFEKWFETLGYSLNVPPELSATSLLTRMKVDKKASYQNFVMVLLDQVGQAKVYNVAVDDAMLVLKQELGES
ncbi:LOW QUALITY PROTEIN: 3-dehydroquinate synthase [Bacillus sp. JCM 19045]|nr:LOW QUALITY PROTEIN: 3-dehydroquinate synthase [Bacillus sp. JCM 19045]